MVVHLPALQDKQSGHWYQLPVRKGEAGNYIESSCTAMFAYGIQHALDLGLVKEKIIFNLYHLLIKAYESIV
jgi:unsaturated rhamnogalacturonyl hydrolase